jgi:hypothetical protein
MTGELETCPVGTMDAMTALEAKLRQIHDDPRYMAVWQVSQAHIGPYKGPQYEAELDRVTAILTAHQQRMGQEPVVKESLTVATPEPDYTSETEDLTTWPETRGPEWRRMGGEEIIQTGDVGHSDDLPGFYFCPHGDTGFYVAEFHGFAAWTSRPKPQEAG